MSVIVYDNDRAFQNRFGREGKRPGEFVNPINIQATNQFIYISDQSRLIRHKYTFEGDFVESIPAPAKISGFYDIQLLSDHEYLSPAEGQRGHLVVYRDTQTDSSFYFGKAMGGSIATISLEKNKCQAQKGEIADMFKNNILIAGLGAHYYIFLKAYGRLEKYDRKGTLLWDKQFEFSFMKAVFNDYVETNKNLQIPTIRTLSYAQDMEVAAITYIYLWEKRIK